MTPQEFAARLERIAEAVPREVSEAVELTQRHALQVADYRSSGTLTAQQLAQKPEPDHPFARRHGTPKLDPGFINQRSGRFRASWRGIGPAVTPDGDVKAAAVNIDPKAALYLESGTDVMFNRPIADRVAAQVEPTFSVRVEAAVERALDTP